MSVQVVYNRRIKSTKKGIIALFVDEKHKFISIDGLLNNKENSYLKNILKEKKGDKKNIFSINLNEKKNCCNNTSR